MPAEFILGLDIGVASIGWALVEQHDGQPAGLKAAGARVFEAGVKGDIAAGLDKSRATARREARSRRRQLSRRRRRLTKLARLLQRAALLPPGELNSPEQLLGYFDSLDHQLFPSEVRHRDPHTMHYRLRARALDERLTAYEIGRAFYHLAHRRGFLSNRKTAPRRSDAEGVVKKEIGQLGQRIEDRDARTLGKYLSGLDPADERLRGRYLGRKEMVQPEFEAIWQAQAAHYPELLTEALKQEVSEAIFFQRPLKTPARFIGYCELERDQRRAPLAVLPAQRFRLLQKVNDLKIKAWGASYDLTDDQRRRLTQELETKEDLSFDDIRKLLPELSEARFNFETFGEEKLIGNRSAARIAKALGKKHPWQQLPSGEQERLVQEVRTRSRDAIARRARQREYDEKTAEKLSRVRLEEGYCRLSRRALASIVPLMESGMRYAAACKQCYPDLGRGQASAVLPPLDDVVEVRNPTVERALTEVRKVVNAVVRTYGTPSLIRIELARDLKRNREQRKSIYERTTKNQRDRAEARAALDAMGYDPSPRDVEKCLLWWECNRQCPYTGLPISEVALFGAFPEFQVEHIIPLPRSLDNTFANKTLCHVSENLRKSNRTPWEAYGHDPDKWREILDRVGRFRGGGRAREVRSRQRSKQRQSLRTKLDRFQLREARDLAGFTDQQLTDTQYAARLAVEYVGQLYGAGADGNDAEGTKRVQAARGQVTSALRGTWGLNFLGAGEKAREDHRQHAVDAVCVALTDAETIKLLSEAAERGLHTAGQRIDRMEPPWPTLRDDVAHAVYAMVVSHRVSRTVRGQMHNEMFWSPRRRDAEGKEWVHQRKALSALSEADLDSIVDDGIRRRVKDRLRGLDLSNPKQAFRTAANLPTLSHQGREVPIRKVRIRRRDKTRTIGQGARAREVMLESNYHIELFAVTDAKGKVKWDSEVVSTYDAMRRARRKEPVVQHDREGFLFSLAQGEAIELDEGADRGRAVYVVAKITKRGEGQRERRTVGIVRHDDARMSTAPEKEKARSLREPSAEVLRKQGCRKVVITPLGEVRNAGD